MATVGICWEIPSFTSRVAFGNLGNLFFVTVLVTPYTRSVTQLGNNLILVRILVRTPNARADHV